MVLDHWTRPGHQRPMDTSHLQQLGVARHPPAPSGAGRATRLEGLRVVASDVITRAEAATDAEQPALLIQLRAMQDEIGFLKHRHPIMGEAPSALAWVDDWSPQRR